MARCSSKTIMRIVVVVITFIIIPISIIIILIITIVIIITIVTMISIALLIAFIIIIEGPPFFSNEIKDACLNIIIIRSQFGSKARRAHTPALSLARPTHRRRSTLGPEEEDSPHVGLFSAFPATGEEEDYSAPPAASLRLVGVTSGDFPSNGEGESSPTAKEALRETINLAAPPNDFTSSTTCVEGPLAYVLTQSTSTYKDEEACLLLAETEGGYATLPSPCGPPSLDARPGMGASESPGEPSLDAQQRLTSLLERAVELPRIGTTASVEEPNARWNSRLLARSLQSLHSLPCELSLNGPGVVSGSPAISGSLLPHSNVERSGPCAPFSSSSDNVTATPNSSAPVNSVQATVSVALHSNAHFSPASAGVELGVVLSRDA